MGTAGAGAGGGGAVTGAAGAASACESAFASASTATLVCRLALHERGLCESAASGPSGVSCLSSLSSAAVCVCTACSRAAATRVASVHSSPALSSSGPWSAGARALDDPGSASTACWSVVLPTAATSGLLSLVCVLVASAWTEDGGAGPSHPVPVSSASCACPLASSRQHSVTAPGGPRVDEQDQLRPRFGPQTSTPQTSSARRTRTGLGVRG